MSEMMMKAKGVKIKNYHHSSKKNIIFRRISDTQNIFTCDTFNARFTASMRVGELPRWLLGLTFLVLMFLVWQTNEEKEKYGNKVSHFSMELTWHQNDVKKLAHANERREIFELWIYVRSVGENDWVIFKCVMRANKKVLNNVELGGGRLKFSTLLRHRLSWQNMEK